MRKAATEAKVYGRLTISQLNPSQKKHIFDQVWIVAVIIVLLQNNRLYPNARIFIKKRKRSMKQ